VLEIETVLETAMGSVTEMVLVDAMAWGTGTMVSAIATTA
jgi:hypothetical protein